MITDELWGRMEPALPSGAGRRGRPWRDHWQVLEAIAWRFRTGCPWRTCRRSSGRGRRLEAASPLVTDGTYQRVFERVLALQDQARQLDWLLWSTRPSFVPITTLPARPQSQLVGRITEFPSPIDHGWVALGRADDQGPRLRRQRHPPGRRTALARSGRGQPPARAAARRPCRHRPPAGAPAGGQGLQPPLHAARATPPAYPPHHSRTS